MIIYIYINVIFDWINYFIILLFYRQGRHFPLLQSSLALWTLSSSLKRSGRVANRSLTTRAEIKDAWHYNSIPPRTLMARCFWLIPKLSCRMLIGLASSCWVFLAMRVGMAPAHSSHVTSCTSVFSSWTWHGVAKFISVTIRSNIGVPRTRELTCHFHVRRNEFQYLSNNKLGFLHTGPRGCPETSARNYHYSLRNSLEECSSQK
jgi:hypothetical protein